MVDTAAEMPSVDGRRARRTRNRAAVVDAVLALIEEDEATPTVEAIAARAGVSVSSIFRYFENLDDLHQQTIEHHFARVAPLFEVPEIGEGPLDGRLARFVDARLDLYEAIAPVARVARARALDAPAVARSLALARAQVAGQARTHLAPELAARTPARADDLVGLVDTLTSFEAWDLLASVHGRTRAQVRRAWTTALTALTA